MAGKSARERADLVDFVGAAIVAAEIVAALALWFLDFVIDTPGAAVGAGKSDQYL